MRADRRSQKELQDRQKENAEQVAKLEDELIRLDPARQLDALLAEISSEDRYATHRGLLGPCAAGHPRSSSVGRCWPTRTSRRRRAPTCRPEDSARRRRGDGHGRPRWSHRTRVEAEFLPRLAELLPTPRAMKRFSNLHRLMRPGVPASQLPRYLGDPAVGGPYQAAALLLAILISDPGHVRGLLTHLGDLNPGAIAATDVVDALRADAPGSPWHSTGTHEVKDRTEVISTARPGARARPAGRRARARSR